MKYENAIDLISQKYNVQKLDNSSCEIMLNKMFDEFNFCFLALKNGSEGCFLSDFAQTAQFFEDLDEKQLQTAAESCNLVFDDYYIKCKFNSMADIDKFIQFFDLLINSSNN